MSRLPPFLRILLAAAVFVEANPAHAVPPDPVPSLDLRGYRPSTDPAGGFYIEPVSTPDHGDTNVGLALSYAYRPVWLREKNTGEEFNVITHQLTGALVGSIGAFGRLSFGADLPFVLGQTGDTPNWRSTYALGPTNIPEQAFGDLAVTVKFVLMKPTAGKMGGFALALHDRFTVPTGDPGSFLGEGHVTNTARLLAELRFLVLGLHAAAGVKLRGETERFSCANVPSEPEDACPQRFGHEIPYAFGLSFRPQALGIDSRGRWTFLLESQGHLPLYPMTPLQNDPGLRALEIGAGARLSLGDAYVMGGVSGGVYGIGAAQVRGMLTVGYAPRERDEDHDGVPDEDDQCRELPEDKDGFEDDDGCPDGDNDNDGVPDSEDQCPKQKEDEDGIDDDDGCPERAWGT
jgi:OmpA-OmpF porin, OOP family